MRISQEHVDSLYSAEVIDQDGDKVGGVGQVYLDDDTGAPAWVTVKTGLFGTSETFVPLASADFDNGQIRVPYEKGFIKDAPNMDADRHLDEPQQEELYRYYNLGSGGYDADTGVGQTVGDAGVDTGTGTAPVVDLDRQREDAFDDRSDLAYADTDRTADTGSDRMTLHEERVDVGTERVQTGRVRLRKHVVRDTETVTVPVEREEYEIVREPVTDGQVAGRADLGEDEIDVAVHEERPVIDKDVVATEQVGVDRRVVTDQERVTTDVAREEVDVVDETTELREGDVDRRA